MISLTKTLFSWFILLVAVAVIPTLFLVHVLVGMSSFFVPISLYHMLEDGIWGWYQEVVLFCFEHCSSVKFNLHGDIPNIKEKSIYISNHQSSMDWIVADVAAFRQNMQAHMRYVFKDSLKYFPIYGYIWGVHGGIFVKRDGTYNIKYMHESLTDLKQRTVPFYLVIFPEGTRYNYAMKDRLLKSQYFAKKKNVEPLSHVLLPRVKAVHYGVNEMRDQLKAVYDVTIIYESNDAANLKTPPSILGVLQGECKSINIIFNRIPVEDIPPLQSEDATFKWLHSLFKIKDDQFQLYYKMKEHENGQSEFEKQYPMKELKSASLMKTGFSMASAVFLMLSISYYSVNFYFYTVILGTIYGLIYVSIYV